MKHLHLKTLVLFALAFQLSGCQRLNKALTTDTPDEFLVETNKPLAKPAAKQKILPPKQAALHAKDHSVKSDAALTKDEQALMTHMRVEKNATTLPKKEKSKSFAEKLVFWEKQKNAAIIDPKKEQEKLQKQGIKTPIYPSKDPLKQPKG